MSSEDIMSGREAATYLGVSYARLYTLIGEGKLTRLDSPGELHRRAPLRFARSEVEELKRRDDERRGVKKSRSAA